MKWTRQLIKTHRNKTRIRIGEILDLSKDDLRQKMKQTLGFTPDTTVSLEALRRYLVELILEQEFPDSLPNPESVGSQDISTTFDTSR